MKKQSEKPQKKKREKRKATLLEALSAVLVLLVIFFFGSLADLSAPALMGIALMYVVFIGYRCGYTWKDLEDFSAEKIKAAAPANSVLIAVGFLLGAWMFSGTIPMFIYYGVQLVSAKWILVSAFILCAIFSTCTGTSWGSAATAGITMMGIAMAMPGVNIAAVAGACYTGAIFGDKLSPLSDTTILASLATKNDIFDHIKNMSKTVIPGGLIGLVVYGVMGIKADAAGAGLPENTLQLLDSLDGAFKWNVIVLLPMVLLVYGCIAKKPSTVIMMLSAVLAVLVGVFYQGFTLEDGITALYGGFNLEMVEHAKSSFIAADAGDDAMSLLNRGGLASMMKSFITVYICLYFAAIMEHIGAIEALLGKLLLSVKTRFSLVFVTSISCVVLTAIGGSSTLALILTGEMYSEKYKEMGLSTLNLSRTMEDFCTGTAGFIPWSASGIYYPSVLGIPIAQYFPYCFMSYAIWILAYFYSITGICMKPLEKEAEVVTA